MQTHPTAPEKIHRYPCPACGSDLLYEPIAFALASKVTASLVFYIISANTLFGLIAGYLYWKKGLEAAIIAHMMAHVVLVTAVYFGA